VGTIVGFVGGIAGVPIVTIRNVSMIFAALIGVPIGIYVVQVVLRKSFRHFKICLVATEAGTRY